MGFQTLDDGPVEGGVETVLAVVALAPVTLGLLGKGQLAVLPFLILLVGHAGEVGGDEL